MTSVFTSCQMDIRLIAVTRKYTRIDELTPGILNTFVDKILVHECEKKYGKRTQDIDICYSCVGIADNSTDEEIIQWNTLCGLSPWTGGFPFCIPYCQNIDWQ